MQNSIEFIREIDRIKGVTRKNRPLGMERFENAANAAEHSWQVAVLAFSLAEFADPAVDQGRLPGAVGLPGTGARSGAPGGVVRHPRTGPRRSG